MAISIEQPRPKNHQVAFRGFRGAPVGMLHHGAPGIPAAIRQARIIEIAGMAVGIRHAMAMAFQQIAFDEFDALVTDAHVVSICRPVASMRGMDPAVVADGDAIEFIHDIPRPETRVRVAMGPEPIAPSRHEQKAKGNPRLSCRFPMRAHA